MSLEQSSNGFDLGKVIAREVGKRVGQGRALSVKQFAYQMQMSEQNVWNLLSGNQIPNGRTLFKMVAFFDISFTNEILSAAGIVAAKAGTADAAFLIKANRAEPALRALTALAELAEEGP